MVSFAERWDEIIDCIKKQSKPMSLGVDPDGIIAGDWRKDTIISPPSIIVYLTPGRDLPLKPGYIETVATARIYCIVGARDDVKTASSDATAMAWKVVQALRGIGPVNDFRWPPNPVRLDSVHSDFCAALVMMETTFGV